MKRGLIIVSTLLVLLLACQYQKPVLTTEEAIMQAYEYLLDPPEEYGDGLIPNKDLEDMWPTFTRLTIRHGFFYEMMNRREWQITFRYEGMEPTVIIDSITGKFIMIDGPLN